MMAKHRPKIPEDLMSQKAAAEWLGLTVKTIQNWISAGRLPYWDVFGIRMVSKADLLRRAVKYG